MPRSRVLRGQPEPRSRAKARHRHDKRKASEPEDPAQALREAARDWLSNTGADEHEALMRLDLKDYLRSTVHIPLPPAERLRRLAVVVESGPCVGLHPYATRWSVLERIYDKALAYTPDEPDVLCSMGISLQDIALISDEGPQTEALWRRAIGFNRQAAAADPEDTHFLYTLGCALYFAPHADREEALSLFEAILDLRPDHNWAKLFKAHCLHDAERWIEAAQAYGTIRGDAFQGHQAWRWALVREQRAWCILQAGDKTAARIEFESLMASAEKALDAGLDTLSSPVLSNPLAYLRDAAQGPLEDTLGDRWRALNRRLRGSMG